MPDRMNTTTRPVVVLRLRRRLQHTLEVLDELPQLTRDKRARESLGYVKAAEQIGISVSMLHGLEHGDHVPLLSTVRRVLRWLAT